MNTEDDEFARIAREQALNKKADNARELGLDYEPDIPFGDNNPGLQWDEVPQAFNDWWNADYDPTGNPFEKDTHAYWAWAGWKAAKQSAQQAPAPGYCKHCKQYTIEELLPAQRTWVGLTDEMLADCVPDEALIVERDGDRTRVSMTRQQLHEFANRAIEAAHDKKENT